ncbi:MAG: hypothetical protein EA377_00740 [Phycisphaerales bacterium]|nr:MAG: hypothetical protein EA377_00740 [Phycisphaerales bacterium]
METSDMAVSASRARTLCTASELNLVKWSSPRQIKSLTPAKLKEKIDRARKLRDKYRDLAKKQRGEARGKRKPTGRRPAQSNENTVEKAELFAEVLNRFQEAATKADASSAGSKKTSTKKKKAAKSTSKKNTTKKKTARKTGKKVSTKAASKKTTKKKSTMKKKKKSSSQSAGGRTADTKRTKPTTKAASSKTTPRVALGGSSDQKNSASLSASSGSRGINPLTGSSALEEQAARRTRRKKSSKNAKAGGIDSRFAATVTDKIQGHISGSNKRRQARRDSKS